MEKLLKQVEELKRGDVRKLVGSRMKEFGAKRSDDELFSEMCFCILTANYNAEGGLRIQKEMEGEFCTLSQRQLAKRLKGLGHRFPNARAKYIAESQRHVESLGKLLKSFANEAEAREWMAENVKGLGYKEASHFLRNVGFKDLAIIDFHIIDLLVRHGIIDEPKTLTKAKYLEIEGVLRTIGKELGLSLAELDMYLWYLETGSILK